MPRGKGIYRDEPRDKLEQAKRAVEPRDDADQHAEPADGAPTDGASPSPQEPPD